MNVGGKVVCVTGASGYIASWIVKLLLLRGYTVRATVRNPTDAAKTEHLLALEGAKERLKLFKADLLEECSFEQAIECCDAVFHTASPVKFIVTNPQTELIDPALKGTMNVLNTCKKTSSVKRVIVTSSMAAVIVRQPPLEPNDVVDESFFSDPSVCMETEYWYPLSKTLAENVAFVDVRDVALAHVKALETPSANGRYIMDGATDTAETEHLLALEGAKERLKLFKADLLEDCSFEQAIEGCDAVFHTASPVKFIVTDPQTELIDPAVKGTLNVLNTCKKTSSVKRVIVTSSTAAVLVRQPPLEPNDVVDETFFSDPNLWYPLSKTLAENVAWQFAKDNGMDMGKNPFNCRYYSFVDVRDVALAHVKALETPSANGRYIISGPSVTINHIKETMRELFPKLCIDDTNGEGLMDGVNCTICVDKVKNLGVEFTPLKSSLRDTIISLKEKWLL
ncbi:hypothetical protein YC2023_069644 [Brassica napus]